MKHGGDVLSYADQYAGEIIDFSSNINPLGAPKALKEKLLSGFEDVLTYPDIQYRDLKKDIGEYLGCSNTEVIVGNGAVEIIDNIIKMFNRVVAAVPCFGEYLERAKINKKTLVLTNMGENFKINISSIEGVLEEGDLLILGNPNNPTGKRIQRDMLMDIYNLVLSKNAFLLLDEAFYEFSPTDYDSIELFNRKSNVCIIRAATKFFALPGIRLGYAWAEREVVKNYEALSLPWSVNCFAHMAGCLIFKDREYIEQTKKYVGEQRAYLLRNLAKISYLKVFESDANFILIKLINYNEDELFNFLVSNGILIRRAFSFEGLDYSYLRIAVKDYNSNEKLLRLLKEFEKWKQ